MPRKIVVWLLNRAASWDPGPILNALSQPGRTVVLGDRTASARGTGRNPDHGILMYEGSDMDEYFIPIPVKCIGNPALLSPSPAKAAAFQAIQAFYSLQYFAPGASYPWSYFWQNNPKAVFGDLTMNTAQGWGYYKILQDYNAQPGNEGSKHLLIGYSQGGLVARFLAYMDEFLFDNALIHGIVTIESPNFGSPVARTDNAVNVAQSLSLVLAGFAQLDAASFPVAAKQLRDLSAAPAEVDMAWLLTFLESALAPFGPASNRTALFKSKQATFRFLSTARKWLSGLDSRMPAQVFSPEESAFRDLNLSFEDQRGSVLNCVNTSPLERILHAAIAGADNQLDQLAEDMLAEFTASNFWLHLATCLFRNKINAFLHGLLGVASAAYTNVMVEQGTAGLPPAGPLPRMLARYQAGVPEDAPGMKMQNGGIGPLAHDFVIPSVYELIENPDSASFLGNWVNPGANHLSGADPNLAGKQSIDLLTGILKTM